jgi:non-heme chloroperoxidase
MKATAALSLGALLFSAALAFAQPEPTSHFAELDGVRVHYTNYGTGEQALLFVHGWSSDETVWKKQAPELAKSIRVITVDLPGHGQSDQPDRLHNGLLRPRARRRPAGRGGKKSHPRGA